MARREYGTGSVSDTPDKNGWYVARLDAGFKPNGDRRRLVRKARTQAEAKRRLKEMRREVAEGTSGPDTRATVRTYAATWLEQRAHEVRPKTYANDAAFTRRWIVPTIGHRRLTKLTRRDVLDLHAALRNAGRSTAPCEARTAHSPPCSAPPSQKATQSPPPSSTSQHHHPA